jgi:hypothetical protein
MQMVEQQMIYSPERKKQLQSHNEYYKSPNLGYLVKNGNNLPTGSPSSRSEWVLLYLLTYFPIFAGFQLTVFPRVRWARPLTPLFL